MTQWIVHSYLCVDLTPTTPKELRLRTNLFAEFGFSFVITYSLDGLQKRFFVLDENGKFMQIVEDENTN